MVTDYRFRKLNIQLLRLNSQQNIHQNHGFTMIEVLIVIFMISILSAIVAPSWFAFVNNRSLNAAQDQVYRTMREAQGQATREKLTYKASFREKNGIVQWAVHPATIEPANANWVDLDTNVRLDTSETTLYKVSKDGVDYRQVEFDYIGSVNLNQLGRLTLSSKSGGKAKRCVFISTILGAMRTAKENPTAVDSKYCY